MPLTRAFSIDEENCKFVLLATRAARRAEAVGFLHKRAQRECVLFS